MEIGGLQKLTLIDYPGKVAVTVFTVYCNFRCPFCYSTEIVLPEKTKKQPRISQKDFFSFLKEKKDLIEGVVICGGEPTIHKDLSKFCSRIKKMGFSVKLDTNGSDPKTLKNLIDNNLVDYVAMDIKSPKDKYFSYTGEKVKIKDIEKSIKILKESGINYEFRTTVAPGITKKDIFKIAKWIGPAKSYFLQEVNLNKEIIDPTFKKIPFLSKKEIKEIILEIKDGFKTCKIR